MRLKTNDVEIEADSVEAITALFALIGARKVRTSEGVSEPPNDEETTLRAEYARANNKQQCKLTAGMLNGQTPLEYLRAWKAGTLPTDEPKPEVLNTIADSNEVF